LHQGDRRRAAAESDFLVKLRQQGSNQVKQSRLPHKRDEEWLFTDLSDLVKVDFQPAQPMTLNRNVLNHFIL
jgi:Fe-S cluster assembly protein SufD